MTSMIERVARAICLEIGRMGDPLPIEMQRVDRDWKDHKPVARAAIEAMRELPVGHPILLVGITTAGLWRRSIDAALKETAT